MGNSARTKAAARRTPIRRPAGPPLRTWLPAAVAITAAVAALVVWQAGRPGTSAPVALTHVHGLGVNSADGSVYVATHDGLYRLAADGAARLVGHGRQDTMGFTIAGPNQFLASGHPASGQDGPRHLGLIESSDAGATWKALSLGGEADFHVLRFRQNTVYGYNSVRGQLLASTDRIGWQTRATTALRDFDVSPADPNTMLATTEAGIQRSTDGGATWSPTGGPAALLLAWEAPYRLWAVSTTGDVLHSTDGGSSWTPTGRLAGQAAAFVTGNGSLYAAVHERGIFSSADGGATWTQLYGQT